MSDGIGNREGAELERIEANLRSAAAIFLLKKNHKTLRQGKREKTMASVTVLCRQKTM